MSILQLHRSGDLCLTDIFAARTARRKCTAFGKITGVRHHARNRLQPVSFYIQIGDGLKQSLCIWVLGMFKDLIDCSPFHHAPGIHNIDLICLRRTAG